MRSATSATGRDATPATGRDLPPHPLASLLPALALLSAILFAGLLALFPISSFDIWWHLRTGRWIVEEARIPFADPFTYTATGNHWVTHEWLTEVLFFGLYRLGGVDLLVVCKALLAALAVGFGACAGIAGPRGRERLPAVAVGALLAALLIAPRAFVRPHMLTAVLFGVTLLLLRLDSATGQRRWRLLLIPLFIVWSNLHSGFVLGLLLILLYWLGELLGERMGGATAAAAPAWRERGLILVLAAIGSLLNPHHVEAFLYPARLVARAEVRETIAELRSILHPAYRGALFLKAMAMTALLVAALLVGPRHRLHAALLLPGLIFGALAITSVRGVSELAVLVPALIGVHGGRLGGGGSSEERSRGWRAAPWLVSIAVLVGAAGGALAASRWGVPTGTEAPRRPGLGVDAVNRPAAAGRFLRQAKSSGRIFNVMAFGGYLIHELWPERQVYIDGRLDIFPTGFIAAYRKLMETGEGWEEIVREHGIGLALVDYHADPASDRGLRARLRASADWGCVFFGDNFVIYARRERENEDIRRRFGSAFDPSLRSRESVAAFTAQTDDAGRDRAVAALREMIALAPEEAAPALVLVQLCLLGADAERNAGKRRDAIRVLEQAAATLPTHYLIQLRLGVMHAELDQLDRARHHFDRALRLRPGDPAASRNLELLQNLERR